MKLRQLLLLLALLPLCMLGQRTHISPSDAGFVYEGRISFANADAPRWHYPGVQIRCTFTGTSVRLLTKPGSGFFICQIDDASPFKVESTTDNEGEITLATGLPAALHTLCITYAIEGLTKHPAFYGLSLDAGCQLGERPQRPARKMEFIGNSITCGFGIEGDGTEKKFSYSQQNITLTYEALTAQAFDARWQVVARSGIGLYRNCNGKRGGDYPTMRDYYDYTLFATSGERWDFNRYQPDVVCVNLGTNDTTNPGYDAELLKGEYIKFVKTLRSHYPQATIVLLTGTMIRGQRLADVQAAQQAAVEAARQRGDKAVYRFDFTPEDGSLGYGTMKHPSRARHQRMAEELIPFISQITGWETIKK